MDVTNDAHPLDGLDWAHCGPFQATSSMGTIKYRALDRGLASIGPSVAHFGPDKEVDCRPALVWPELGHIRPDSGHAPICK